MSQVSSWPPAWVTPTSFEFGSRGDDAIDFINTFVTLTKDSIAGKAGESIKLRVWQEQLLRETLVLDERGLFARRTALWGMARKNGKSALITGLGLWFLFNGDEGGEVYSCAAEKEQARITFGDAKKIIEREPELAAMCNVYRDVIELPSTGSIWRVLSAEAYSKEGLNASAVIFDEVHALQDRTMWDVMQLSMASRQQPIMLATTTCGVKADNTGQDSTAYQLYQYGQRVARGEVVVKRTPEAEFRTKRCNQWVSSKTAWLPAGVWDTLQDEVVVPDDADVVLGVDGSFSGDTTAIVAVTVPKTPEDKPYVWLVQAWEKQPTDNDDWRVDTVEVEQTIIAFCQRFRNVKEIAFDPFRWQRSMAVLQDVGLPIVEFASTSPRRMIPACQKVYDSVTEGTLTHDGSPLLARHLDNCVLKVDAMGARIVKESRNSARRIDAAVAFVIAYDRATSKIDNDIVPEFYVF